MDARFPTYYMDKAVFDLSGTIETAKERLAGVDFDTLVGAGFSGAIVIPALALALNKKFVLVRKDSDDSHHGKGRLVGALGARWIFVDDFVSSGWTRDRVLSKVAEWSREYECPTEYVGQYMYEAWNADDSQGRYETAAWATRGFRY